ncbi:PHD finger domain-containing protein [Halalkalicoccus subterraneus]|uniref:hypothetical protein n=1 Tax=Halalkalicoccus subterraneus TaxID=2675002 RepID=UPI000EFC060D|nr:hypothetical protein [Halalkalicoccus subterraneus]
MLITTPAEQLLTGFPILETRCQYCKSTLGEGDPVSAYVVRYAGDDEWTIPHIYCRDCQSTITDPTLGATELLAEGHLGVTMDATTQRASLTLLEIERITKSAPEEGHVTL